MGLPDEIRRTLEAFVDADLSVGEFEGWLYENGSRLSEVLGEETYLELASIDFREKRARDRIVPIVERVLEDHAPETAHDPGVYQGIEIDRRPPEPRIEEVRDRIATHYERASEFETKAVGEVVPEPMRAGDVGDDHYVHWRLVKSTVTSREVAALEAGLPAELPASLRAYLFSYAHLFDQFRAAEHRQLAALPPLPTTDPLSELRSTVAVWRMVLAAGYVPFGTWGDGWGPMCLDTARDADEPPVAWIDHEPLLDLSARADRDVLVNFAEDLYPSFEAALADLFAS